MSQPSPKIRYLMGAASVLVVAPHGPKIREEYLNDMRTGVIAEQIQRRLNCRAIINDGYVKPTLDVPKSAKKYRLDMFKISDARKVSGYLDAIRAIADMAGHTLVVWVHGITDDVATGQGREHVRCGRFDGPPEALSALIGYGQKRDPQTGAIIDRPSARPETVRFLRERLTAGGLATVITRRGSRLFRGHHVKRFNQWFIQNGYGFDQVESIQLEIKETGFRDSDENAVKTAAVVAGAIAEVVSIAPA